MDSPRSPSVTSFLAQRVREGASADQIAEVVAAAWQQINTALMPVIGQRGVVALYKRSAHLAAAGHSCLAAVIGSGQDGMDLSALKAVLARQPAADAAAAGGALLLSFHALVGSLIGSALTGQLLGSVWVNFFSGPAAQDPSS